MKVLVTGGAGYDTASHDVCQFINKRHPAAGTGIIRIEECIPRKNQAATIEIVNAGNMEVVNLHTLEKTLL